MPDGSFLTRSSNFPPVALDDAVRDLLSRDCVVAVGVSGGKDSVACALAVNDHLDAIGHTGPRVLVHADLGKVEWKDSLPTCQRLAARIGWELIVVSRKAGGMMERWESRWAANLARYQDLSCVKIILPWSTPSMRFCTSELKVDVITRELKKLFPGQDILNVAGIRRQESAARKQKPISSPEGKLKRGGNFGLNWNAIIEWNVDEVFARIAAAGLEPHEAYKLGSSRVSCAFCIMGSLPDLTVSANCADNQEVYLRMVELEAASTFAFQGSRWLADVAPWLLPPSLKSNVALAKEKALKRHELEAMIPDHLLYTKGWPTVLPTDQEAAHLADIRNHVAALFGVENQHRTAKAILARYTDLMATLSKGQLELAF